MVAAFLLAFPALFSIVNPIAGAFIFRGATANRTHLERATLARRVGTYSLLVMLVSLWAGSYVLATFGISLAALRISGGIVLALFAWELLGAPEKREDRKQEQAADAAPAVAMAGAIWVTYSYADRLSDLLGRTGSKTVTRLSAFILFCIGVQMLITGVVDVLGPLLGAR